jgi:hypothetical protein
MKMRMKTETKDEKKVFNAQDQNKIKRHSPAFFRKVPSTVGSKGARAQSVSLAFLQSLGNGSP